MSTSTGTANNTSSTTTEIEIRAQMEWLEAQLARVLDAPNAAAQRIVIEDMVAHFTPEQLGQVMLGLRTFISGLQLGIREAVVAQVMAAVVQPPVESGPGVG